MPKNETMSPESMKDSSYHVARIGPQEANECISALVTLLQDAVENGASVGFMMPLPRATAEQYWEDVIADLTEGSRLLWVARDSGGICGTIQLGLCQKPNGTHRAEVQKLLVHSSARRRGIGSALMAVLEDAALGLRRHLLYLDTEPGQPAEQMYQQKGWIRVGEIPEYASTPTGELHATALYFKRLPKAWIHGTP